MPITFSTTAKKDPRDQTAAPKYYAITRSTGRADSVEIARQIARMSSLSTADSAGMVEAILAIISDELSKGHIVELGDFGSFRISVSSEGQASADEVTADKITEARVIFTPGPRFKDVLTTLKFQRASEG